MEGHVGACICDLYRMRYFPMRKEIAALFTRFEEVPFSEIEESLEPGVWMRFKEWIIRLEDMDYLLVVEPHLRAAFPPYSIQLGDTSGISSAIARFSSQSRPISDLLEALHGLLVKNLFLIIVDEESIADSLLQLEAAIKKFSLEHLEIAFPSKLNWTPEYSEILANIKCLRYVFIGEQVSIQPAEMSRHIGVVTYKELKHQPGDSKPTFRSNPSVYAESAHANPYFNGKIFIDENGDLFNPVYFDVDADRFLRLFTVPC